MLLTISSTHLIDMYVCIFFQVKYFFLGYVLIPSISLHFLHAWKMEGGWKLDRRHKAHSHVKN